MKRIDFPKEHQENLDLSLKLIAKSSFIVFIGLALSKILGFLYRILIARYFGPEAYGLFTLALMVMTIFVALSALGLNEGLLRQIPVFRGKSQFSSMAYLFRLTYWFSLISSIIFSIILFLASKFISLSLFHNSALVEFLRISSAVVPFYVLSNLYLNSIRAFEKIGWYSFIINILQNVVRVILLAMLIIIGLNTSSIMISYLLSIVIMLVVSRTICRKYAAQIFWNYSLKKKEKIRLKKQLFAYSLLLMFSGFISMLFIWVDSFSIGYLKNATEVGFYNTAMPVALLLSIIPDIFIQLFYPLITKEYSKNNLIVVREASKQVAKWIFILALPAFILIFMFPGAAINILFGPEYLLASNSLKILAVGAFISILNGFLTTLLLVAGKPKNILFNLLLTSVINLILNFILIPIYGIAGAAIATSASWIILSLILFIQVSHSLSFIPLRKEMVRIFLISLVPLGFLIVSRAYIPINLLSLAILTICFLLLYGSLIYVFNCLDKNDFTVLFSIKKRVFSMKGMFYKKSI